MLQQKNNQLWEPLSFFSKKLSNAEIKYSAFDRELLAVYLATRRFRYFIEGREITIFTDHKPLTYAMSAKTERSPRQTRQLDFISQFTTNIKYIRGKDNVVADSLSRIGESEIAGAAKAQDLKVDLENIGKLQVTDEELENLLREEKTHKTSKFRLQNFKFPNMELYCESATPKRF